MNKIEVPDNAIKIKNENNTTLVMWNKKSAMFIYVFNNTNDIFTHDNIIMSNIVDVKLFFETIQKELL